MQAVAWLPSMLLMNFLLSLRGDWCHTMESVYWVIHLLSASGACLHLVGRTIKFCIRRAKLDQRHKAHCFAFPVLSLVSYRMTVITERLLGWSRVTPGAIGDCLANRSPRFLEGSLAILQGILPNPSWIHLHLNTVTLFLLNCTVFTQHTNNSCESTTG